MAVECPVEQRVAENRDAPIDGAAARLDRPAADCGGRSRTRVPVFASSATTSLGGCVKYMMPSTTSGVSKFPATTRPETPTSARGSSRSSGVSDGAGCGDGSIPAIGREPVLRLGRRAGPRAADVTCALRGETDRLTTERTLTRTNRRSDCMTAL